MKRKLKWEYEDGIEETALRVLTGVTLAGIGLLIGFNIGISRPKAAVIRAAHFTQTVEPVEPIPDSTVPDGGLPDAIIPGMVAYAAEKDAMSTPAVGEELGESWESLGTWKLTAYCPERCCNGRNAHKTASGSPMVVGRTVAVGHLPFGTRIMIDGHEYVVEDRGVHGNHVDILFPTHKEANQFGVQYKEVFIKR